MYMNEMEIVGKFRRADDKKEMLEILADLNGCSNDAMKSYLLAHGVAEDEFPKRRKKASIKEAAEPAKGDGIQAEPRKTVAQLAEMPELTPEERIRVDMALAIPEPVRRAIADRIRDLTAKIMEMEKDRDCLTAYLEMEVHSEAC